MTGKLDKAEAKMRSNPQNVAYADLFGVCCRYFGEPRKTGSHVMFKTSWMGDPRVNIQDYNGKAKAYQVRQVISAIDKLNELKEVTP